MRQRGWAVVALSCILLIAPTARADELDELDDANAGVALLEIETEAEKDLLRTMLKVLGETELQELQGFSNGPVIGGKNADERASKVEKYKDKAAELRRDFERKSRELSRARRRVASLEARSKRAPVLSDDLTKKTLERAIDQLFREFDERRR